MGQIFPRPSPPKICFEIKPPYIRLTEYIFTHEKCIFSECSNYFCPKFACQLNTQMWSSLVVYDDKQDVG